jgi:hypothetical protein
MDQQATGFAMDNEVVPALKKLPSPEMSNKSIEFLSENEKKHNHLGELKEAQPFGRTKRGTTFWEDGKKH